MLNAASNCRAAGRIARSAAKNHAANQKSDYLFKDSSEFYAAHAAIKKATAK